MLGGAKSYLVFLKATFFEEDNFLSWRDFFERLQTTKYTYVMFFVWFLRVFDGYGL